MRITAKTIITAVMTGTMRNIRECLKISCKCDAHFCRKPFFKHTLRKISRISRKKYKKTKLVVDKFTKKIYDIAICSLVYIFAEIKDKGYKVEIKEEVHC